MYVYEIVRYRCGGSVAKAAKLLGVAWNSVNQWSRSRAIIVEGRVYVRRKYLNSHRETIVFDGETYSMSLAAPVEYRGSVLNVDGTLSAPDNTSPIILTLKQTAAVLQLTELAGYATPSDTLDAILGTAKPV